MKTRKSLPLLLSVGLCLVTLASCHQDHKKEVKSPMEESQIKETRLGQVITRGMEENPGEDFYILYDASSNEYITLTQEDYMLSEAFGNLLVRQDGELRAGDPKGPGWIVGGKGKGKLEAIKIAYEIADKIEKDKDFEIHVEYHEDGSFTVWYRMIK